MKLSEWRSSFQRFVNARVRIDSWLLERPETYQQLAGFIPPLRDMDYKIDDSRNVILTATQDFIISQRLPDTMAFNDLPLATIEGYYNTLAIAFVANYQAIHADIIDLRFNQVDTPIAVAEVAEDANDWIIDIKWSLRVETPVEPEIGGIVEPFTLRELNARVWRDDLKDDLTDGVSDPSLRVLDFTAIWTF